MRVDFDVFDEGAIGLEVSAVVGAHGFRAAQSLSARVRSRSDASAMVLNRAWTRSHGLDFRSGDGVWNARESARRSPVVHMTAASCIQPSCSAASLVAGFATAERAARSERDGDGGEAVAAVMGMASRLWVLLLSRTVRSVHTAFGRGAISRQREVLSLDLACS